MNGEAFFCTLGSMDIARLIRFATQAVCYAGPGV